MNGRPPGARLPFGRWLALSALLGLPVAVVLAVAVARAALTWREALLIGLPAFAVHLAFAWWHSRTVRGALERAESILADEPRPPGNWDAWTMLGELDATVERLRRHLVSEKGQAALQSTTAEAILNALPDPLLVLDRERRVTRANHAARRLFGNEMVGQDLSLALRHPAALEAADQVLSGQEGLIAVDFTLPTAEGRSFSLRVAALPSSSDARAGTGAGTGVEAARRDMVAVLALHDITALRKAERMRADFVANASHELRTPLASLVGFIETLLGPARDDEPARIRFLGIMRDQAGRMARLINDLLSLSQIEMREHDRPRDAVALAPLLRGLAEALQPQAEARQVTIRLDLDAQAPPTPGARDELLQVFQNLIDNAVKYGRAGSEVRVSLRRHDEFGLEVAVADQGEGIPKQHLPRLTERFYRVDSARSREMGGTGLGLAIVKHIVSRHRGRLVIDSEVGVGSTFSVRLPIVR